MSKNSAKLPGCFSLTTEGNQLIVFSSSEKHGIFAMHHIIRAQPLQSEECAIFCKKIDYFEVGCVEERGGEYGATAGGQTLEDPAMLAAVPAKAFQETSLSL